MYVLVFAMSSFYVNIYTDRDTGLRAAQARLS